MTPHDSEQARWFVDEVLPNEKELRAWLQSRFPGAGDVDDLVQEAFTRFLKAHESGPVVNPRKAYPVDHGLSPVFDRSQKSNMAHSLEVAVHNELLRRGAEVAYVKTRNGHEVDFLSREADGGQALIQVSSSLDDPDTLDREVRALQEANAEFHGGRLLLLTAASRMPFPEVPNSIEVLPAWHWMLEGD